MKRLLPWAFGALLLFAALIAVNTYYAISSGLRLEGMNSGDYLMQLVKWPALVWSALILVVGAVFWVQRVEAAETARAAEHAEATRRQTETEQIAADAARRTLSMQLIGAQLVTPYVTRGLPLQAQLPALLARNPLKKPKPYYMPAAGGRKPYKSFVEQYLSKLISPFETPFWVQRPKGGYPGTSFFYNGLKWTTHKGMPRGQTRPETDNLIPVFVSLPSLLEPHVEPPILAADGGLSSPVRLPPNDDDYTKNYRAMLAAFTPLESINFDLANDLWSYVGNKELGHLPIFYRFGGGTAGFRSLSAAFDYLEGHPTEVVWLMAIDSPNYGPDGKDEQPNEAGILLMLAHRDFDTGREPLAMIHRPQQTPEAPGSRPLTRLKAALSEALARGGVSPDQVGRYFHDAAGGKALGLAAQAATETLPGFDWEKQNYSLPAWLGDMGATTTPYHLLLAAWAANTEGKPMLVANVVGGEDAVLVTPPEHYTPVDTHQPYWAARSENDFSRPWWGKRKDGKPDVGMSPMNKDDGTPADPEPPFELGY
jgi:hypothetical protein